MTFGEECRFKTCSHEPLSGIAGGYRFHEGVFVGIERRTGQYIVHSGDGVKLARTVLRVPEAEKWDKDM